MKKLIFILVMLLFISVCGFSQNRSIQGKVVSQDGSPLTGATVTAENAQKGTITDANGNFLLSINGKDTLVISFIGYESVHVPTGIKDNLGIITLKNQSNELDQLVVTGYQTQKKIDLTGSVAIVSLKDLKDIPSNNLMQALQGRVPGLYVTSSGDPNGGIGSIAVRGFNTLGFTAPLYVIDGVPTIDPSVFQSLDPNSIQSIQILKDASSESIYGSRASNGVIIVTTKAGSKGKINVQFNNSITVQNYATKLKVLNTQGVGKAIWQAAINDGDNPNSVTNLFSYTYHTGNNGYPVLDKINVIPFLGGDSTEPSANTDWQSLVYHSGIITSNDLTITTGSQHSNLLINLNYLNNTGMMKYNNGYRRYGARINASTNMLGNRLKIGNNLQFFQSSETPVMTDLGGAPITYDAIFVSPLIPVYT
ncbi:MAG: TonB-dependent receptor plug domain-containing protein, partial [Chitinophagaceae bacterium]